eukprot:1458098-Amphidinium_carterae.1
MKDSKRTEPEVAPSFPSFHVWLADIYHENEVNPPRTHCKMHEGSHGVLDTWNYSHIQLQGSGTVLWAIGHTHTHTRTSAKLT